MRAQIDPTSGVSGIIIDGRTVGPGETFTIKRSEFDRINQPGPRKVLVEVAEVVYDEPEEDDDETVQED